MYIKIYERAMAERHRQDAVDGIEYSIYSTYEMSNGGYVNIILSGIV